MNKALGIFLKIMAAVGVIAIIVLAIAVEVYALSDIYDVVMQVVQDTSQEDTVIKDCLKSLDLVLLGVIFLTIALGLYELYVCPIENLPDWLVIETLDDLKSLMIKMVVFIIAISFAGRIVTYTEGVDILYLGAAFALVTVALTYFIREK